MTERELKFWQDVYIAAVRAGAGLAYSTSPKFMADVALENLRQQMKSKE